MISIEIGVHRVRPPPPESLHSFNIACRREHCSCTSLSKAVRAYKFRGEPHGTGGNPKEVGDHFSGYSTLSPPEDGGAGVVDPVGVLLCVLFQGLDRANIQARGLVDPYLSSPELVGFRLSDLQGKGGGLKDRAPLMAPIKGLNVKTPQHSFGSVVKVRGGKVF